MPLPFRSTLTSKAWERNTFWRRTGVAQLPIKTKGDGNKMTCLNDLGRRSFLKIAAALGGSTVGALPNLAGAQDTPRQTDTPAVTLRDVPFSSGAKLTIERRGQTVGRSPTKSAKMIDWMWFHTMPADSWAVGGRFDDTYVKGRKMAFARIIAPQGLMNTELKSRARHIIKGRSRKGL